MKLNKRFRRAIRRVKINIKNARFRLLAKSNIHDGKPFLRFSKAQLIGAIIRYGRYSIRITGHHPDFPLTYYYTTYKRHLV